MSKLLFIAAAFTSGALLVSAEEHVLHSFKKIQLTDKFWSEGAHLADFNHDGKMDITSGPFWYEGPDFQKWHEIYPATKTFSQRTADGKTEVIPGYEGALGANNAYSDAFFSFTHDVNGDGWADILVVGHPGTETFWYENPQGRPGFWTRHVLLDVTDNESPALADIDGDGRPELVCNSKGYFGYAKPDPSDSAKPWKFHPITPNNNYHKYTHGLGVGDVNGDGRMDLLEKDGWWEQPASLAGDPIWKQHPYPFAPVTGSSQMFAYDVNGDGLNDIITSLNPHGYGLAWYEQVKNEGEITFKKHLILNEVTVKDQRPDPNHYGVIFSQHHSVDLVDMDGDGLKDIVTGKRFWAHGPTGDVEPNAPAVLYWFKLVRQGSQVDFVPYLIDDNSGVGTQVVAADLDGDSRPDVVVGNKKGTFAFLQQTKNVSQAEWEQAQPKPGSATSGGAKPLRILLVTGGCCHDYAHQKDILKRGLEERANVIVEQVHTDDSSTRPPLAILGHPDYAKGYDLVIHDECAADLSDPAVVSGVLQPHLEGVPGVNLHCAMHSYRIGNPNDPVTLGTSHGLWFEYLGLQSSGHGPQEPISIKFTAQDSPITAGLGDWTTIKEEHYNNIHLFDSAKALAHGFQTVKGKNGTEKTNDYVVAWQNEFGPKKTRVFSTTIGHNNATVEDSRYLNLVTRGVLWATGHLKDDGTPAAGYGPRSK